MLLSTHLAVAGRCPECSATVVEEVSLFQIDRKQPYSLQCSCGAPMVRVEKKKKLVYFQIDCYFCGDIHWQRADISSLRRSWRQVVCPHSRLEVASVGNAVEVYDLVSTWQDVTEGENSDEDEYFTNPEVMYDILEYVQELSESRRIACLCGVNDLDLEVGAGHISLRCPYCKALYIVPAASEENLQQFLDSPPEWVRPQRGRYDRSPR